MPETVGELVELLELEAIEDDLFRGRQPDTLLQRVFGGQVAAQALVAATNTVDPKYVVHSLHSYFLRPGDTEVPIVYDVDNLRDGRTFATRRVLARQHGRPIFAMTANYQVAEDGFEHQQAMPEIPGPDECPDMVEVIERKRGPELAEFWKKEWSVMETRFAGSGRGEEGIPARQRLWIRTNGALPDDPLIHQAAFTYATDVSLLGATLVPHRKSIGSPDVAPASLDHTIWFHRPFKADEWWLYDQETPAAHGGRGLALARVYTEDGTLVASVAQEGLIRKLQQ